MPEIALRKNPWIVRFLRWTLGADDALPLEQPDFGTALEMGILAMCSITDSDDRNTAEQIEAAKTGLLQIFRNGQITHDEFLFGIEHIKCWQYGKSV
jgi:hypothetical protein